LYQDSNSESRIGNQESRIRTRIQIRIRIKIKLWIRIRIKADADPKHLQLHTQFVKKLRFQPICVFILAEIDNFLSQSLV